MWSAENDRMVLPAWMGTAQSDRHGHSHDRLNQATRTGIVIAGLQSKQTG
jgi:hypothetical protein